MRLISTLLLSSMFTAASMGSTLPPVPLARDLAGDWVLSDAGRSCAIHLWIDEIPNANGYRLTVDTCPEACNFSMNAVAWRPAPDGISLLDREGSTLIFFSREANGYRSDIASDAGMRMDRKPGAR
ncbi:AprI/Inh family metalloprotease inhibitor [Comamonas antarctica]|nr:AprI/Inh family metalloprotease inhibitor [Comamonas antarctica]